MAYLVRFDWAIKWLLRNKANFGILEGLLSELLLYDVKIDHILESESNQETKEDKYNRPTMMGMSRDDILVQNGKRVLAIIDISDNKKTDHCLAQRRFDNIIKIRIDELNKNERYLGRTIKMARRCTAKGMPICEIAELTGLSENEIAKLS